MPWTRKSKLAFWKQKMTCVIFLERFSDISSRGQKQCGFNVEWGISERISAQRLSSTYTHHYLSWTKNKIHLISFGKELVLHQSGFLDILTVIKGIFLWCFGLWCTIAHTLTNLFIRLSPETWLPVWISWDPLCSSSQKVQKQTEEEFTL